MSQEKDLSDGYASFLGGMDMSRHVSMLAEDRYYIGVNTFIRNDTRGLSQRDGIQEVSLTFETKKEEDIYRGGNIQQCGWYKDNEGPVFVRSVNGYIFEFRSTSLSPLSLYGKIVNSLSPNNPLRRNVSICTVPGGVVVLDGESAAFLCSKGEYRRSRPQKGEIGSGRMGVYLQNRFFYVKNDGVSIYASTFREPLSLQEAYDDNIYGFASPDDAEITAIGKQKLLLNSSQVGTLAFSTVKDSYTVDVRGARTGWGRFSSQGNVGTVDNSVPDVGAVSSDSFEPFNSNVYFRNREFGLMSFRQSQYQYNSSDSFHSFSEEVNPIFRKDSAEMLSRCYTRKYRDKLLTTVAPQLKDGFVFWNGLVAYSPEVYFSGNKQVQNVNDGIITGVRPWCIQNVEVPRFDPFFLIDSHDCDGVNRMYQMSPDFSFDKSKGERKEIESKIFTRGLSCGTPHKKKVKSNMISLYNVENLDYSVSTRDTNGFSWNLKFEDKIRTACQPQDREIIPLPTDQTDFNTRSFLFKFKGQYSLARLLLFASGAGMNTTVKKEGGKIDCQEVKEEPIYDYSICSCP